MRYVCMHACMYVYMFVLSACLSADFVIFHQQNIGIFD